MRSLLTQWGKIKRSQQRYCNTQSLVSLVSVLISRSSHLRSSDPPNLNVSEALTPVSHRRSACGFLLFTNQIHGPGAGSGVWEHELFYTAHTARSDEVPLFWTGLKISQCFFLKCSNYYIFIWKIISRSVNTRNSANIWSCSACLF